MQIPLRTLSSAGRRMSGTRIGVMPGDSTELDAAGLAARWAVVVTGGCSNRQEASPGRVI